MQEMKSLLSPAVEVTPTKEKILRGSQRLRELRKKGKRNMADMLTEPIEIHRDDYIKVLCMDEQGAGGAHHLYHIYEIDADVETADPLTIIKHQEGGILEQGVNGCTNEALLAICGHRMACFQKGPFPSHYNANAKAGIDFARVVLETRTRDRKSRGVEGKNRA